MFCAISGEVPQDPVLSQKTGHIYERSLIEKEIARTGKCPQTGEDITDKDLISIKANQSVKPRAVKDASIPGLLTTFQNEWDALMLESFTVKKQLGHVRQELSQALYQYDAACRVIARLIKERDEARAALTAQQSAQPSGASSTAMEVEKSTTSIPGPVLSHMTSASRKLSAGRKSRSKPATLASKAQIGAFKQTDKRTLHHSDRPGVTCVHVHPKNSNLVVSGGVDREANVFNRQTKTTEATLSGHTKALTNVLFHPSRDGVVLTASQDKTARVFSKGQTGYESYVVKDHSASVTDLSLHATGEFFATSSMDGTWAFHDLANNRCISQVTDESSGGNTSVAFHPDGLLLGTGTAKGTVAIWDLKTPVAPAKVFTDHSKTITALEFSENGYYMASASEDHAVKLWDLRKLKCVKTLDGGAAFNCLSFDHSGTYLAAGGNDVRVLHVKSWKTHVTLRDSAKAVRGVSLSSDAQLLATASLDRTVRFYAPS